jgi:very-short-patch-repair endonuclease
MWVAYSVDPAIDLKPGDLRRRLIEHAMDPGGFSRELEHKTKKAESDFERRVLQRLVSIGYSVRPQHPVGAYRIDLVVESPTGTRLAVECDGDRYHTLENLDADMARQAVLERLGWKFVRIRGTEFNRNPERALAPVFRRLAELGIEPCEGHTPATRVTSDVHERVLARAAELRSQWEFRGVSIDAALVSPGAAPVPDTLVEAE